MIFVLERVGKIYENEVPNCIHFSTRTSLSLKMKVKYYDMTLTSSNVLKHLMILDPHKIEVSSCINYRVLISLISDGQPDRQMEQ